MSLEALVWALRVPKSKNVDDSALRTLAIMADYANEHGMCWPSRERLRNDRGVSMPTISRHIADLFKEGLIMPGDPHLVSHLQGNRRPRVWQLNLPNRGVIGETPRSLWGLTFDQSGVSPGDTQNPIEPSSKRRTLKSPTRMNARTDAPVDEPDVECVHQHPVTWYWDKRQARYLPRCPYCRRAGLVVIDETAEA